MFEPVFDFSDTIRHSRLVGALYGEYLKKYENDGLYITRHPFTDSVALVYSGERSDIYGARLINALEWDAQVELSFMRFVEPDFMFFENNAYMTNKKQTRILGQPDLIVEVWSETNSEDERAFKRYLYSTSPVSEHWYIEQDSNTVLCYFGEKRLKSQSLKTILRTQSGVNFDLSLLAL